MRGSSSLLLLVLIACSGPGNTAVLCPATEIEISRGVVLGADAGPYSPTQQSKVLALPTGGYVVGPTYTAGTMAMYDSSGQFTNAVGIEGGGPGEYRGIHDLALIGDSLFVADRRLSRVSVLGQDGAFHRAFVVNGALNRLLPLGDSLLVHATPLPGSERGALQVFFREREPTLTFPEPGVVKVSSPTEAREVTVTDTLIVAARRTGFSYELFDRTGQWLREVRPDADWFNEPDVSKRLRGRGASVIQDISGDGSFVWALVRDENDDAERFAAAARAEPNAMSAGMSLALQDSVFDYLLSKVDLVNECVAGTVRLQSGVFSGFTVGGQLIEVRQLPEGHVVLQLWSIISPPFTGGKS